MSSTEMLSTNPLTVKLWEKKAWVQAMKTSVVGHFFNNKAIYFPEKFLGKDTRGDQVTFPFTQKLKQIPIGEGGTADGNEEALNNGNHALVINESRIPVLNPNSGIEVQRSNLEFERLTSELLPKRAVELMDASVFQQLGGANPTSITIDGTTYTTAAQKLHVQGHNTPVAPSANRILRPSAAATDQALTSSDTMTLALIDYALERNDLSDQPIEMFDDNTFELFLSPQDAVNLKHDAGSAINWNEIELAKIMGGKDDYIEERYMNKMICLGRYQNVKIYQASRVAFGVNSGTNAPITTVRRNVLVGKNALAFASPYGGRVTDKDVPMRIKTQLKDYDKYKGMLAELLYGIKKMQPSNGEDIGSMVISTYAAAHS